MKDRRWIQSYIEYTQNQESPEMFHTWVAIGIVSTTINRNIYVDRAYYRLYPNLYIVLVADSARLRKSVSIGIGINLLRKAMPETNVFAQKITAEALIQTLQASYKKNGISSGMIQADELSVFLGKSKENTIIPVLTTLYDSKDTWDYLTIGRGKETCNNTYLTMLAGSTPRWLKDALPTGSVGGGFTSRINFVYQSSTDRSFPHPTKTKKEIDLEKYLITELKTISSIKGIMKWSKEAEKAYADWYITLYNPDKAEEGLEGYYGRKHDVLIKLATIISVSRSDDLFIEGDDLAVALNILNANEVFLP